MNTEQDPRVALLLKRSATNAARSEAFLRRSNLLKDRADKIVANSAKLIKSRPPFVACVERAVAFAGSQKLLAQACGVKPGTIWACLNTKAKMPPWLAMRIVDATSGKVSIKELLPDVYERVEKEVYERVTQP